MRFYFIFSVGSLISIEELDNPHTQEILRGHDSQVLTFLEESNIYRLVLLQYLRVGVTSLLDKLELLNLREMPPQYLFGS